MRDVLLTVDYQQIENSNIANQIHRFTIDYGKFILINISINLQAFYHECRSLSGYATHVLLNN